MAAARVGRPSLVKMLLTWRATVFSLMDEVAGDRSVGLAGRHETRAPAPREPSARPRPWEPRPGRAPPPGPGRARRPAAGTPERAASSSITPVSPSPSVRQASSDAGPGSRAASYGASSSCQTRPRAAQRGEGGFGRRPRRGATAPVAWADDGAQKGRVEVGGDLRQLVGGGARRRDIVGGEQRSRRSAGEQPGAGQAVLCLVERPADRRCRGRELTLGQPQQRQTRLRACVPRRLASAVRLLGLGELAAQPVELGLLVESGAGSRAGPAAGRAARTPAAPRPAASGQAPCNCMISARCTRHWPRKGTRSGCAAHQWLSAAVHSCARRRSKISWQASITPQ